MMENEIGLLNGFKGLPVAEAKAADNGMTVMFAKKGLLFTKKTTILIASEEPLDGNAIARLDGALFSGASYKDGRLTLCFAGAGGLSHSLVFKVSGISRI